MTRNHLEFCTEFRSEDTSGNSLNGFANVFGTYAKTRIGMETISTRAFDRALNEKQDVRAFLNHDPNMLLARLSSGTLQLRATDNGLHVSVPDLPDTSYARDMKVMMARGDLREMSFGFNPKADKWTSFPKGGQLRTITDLDLFDVSVVSLPAYKEASVQLRSMEEIENQPGESVASQLVRIRHSIYLGGNS